MLDKSQVLYGLRNLATGDEEETRITDCIDDVSPRSTRNTVQNLIDQDDYIQAYRLAIRTSEVEVNPIDVLCWSLAFEANESWDNMETGTVDRAVEMMNWDDVRFVTDKEAAINQAFEMWAIYDQISVE